MEMHTVHYPKAPENGIIAAALGIIFDTENYDKSVSNETIAVIDSFFDSLELWNLEDHTVSEVLYGQLLDALETDNRWVYKGSVTTPPCATTVYWNVLNKVYPIKPEHFLLYKEHIWKRQNPGADIDYYGNYRAIQEYNGHDLKMVVAQPPVEKEDVGSTALSIAILLVLFLVCTGVVFIVYSKNSEEIE